MRRAGNLSAKTLLKDAVFVPPGYSSLMFAHLYEANSCPQAAHLFIGFRTWMHANLGLGSAPSVPNTKLRVRQDFVASQTSRFLMTFLLEAIQKDPLLQYSLVIMESRVSSS